MSVNERDNPMQDGPGTPGGSPPPPSPAEQYLWDGTGTPDAEMARLEGTLRVLRHAGELPASVGAGAAVRPRRVKLAWAAAAAVLLAVAGAGLWLARPRGPEQIGPWTVAEKSGAVTVGEEQRLKNMHIGVSREVSVAPGGSMVLRTADGGRVVFKPGAKARIYADAQSASARWVGLSQGMLTVECGTAPIGVDIDGQWAVFEKGTVGQVMFGGSSAEVTVKSGSAVIDPRSEVPTRLIEEMVCRVDRAGPRVPLRHDATREFSRGVRDVQMIAAKDPKSTPKMAEEVAASARREDLATLWNLAWRLEPENRGPIIERLAEQTGLMKQKFAYSAAVKGDPRAMDQLWEAVRGMQAEKTREEPKEPKEKTKEQSPQKTPKQK